MNPRELKEKRKVLHTEAQGLVDAAAEEKRELSTEEDTRVDEIFVEIDSLTKKIERQEQIQDQLDESARQNEEVQERIVRETGREDTTAEEFLDSHKRMFVNHMFDRTDEQDREFMDSQEYRALATQVVGTAGKGGVLVPTDFRASLIVALKDFGGMRRARTTVIDTDNGRNLTVPTSDDTGNVATIVAEATAITASTHVPFSSVTLEAVKYKSGPIKISSELAQDSAIGIEAVVRDAMAVRFGRGTEPHLATRSSTESVGPHGLTNASTGAVTLAVGAGSTTFIDALIEMQHAIDPAYRREGAEWMFNDATFKRVRKLKDGDNQFIWQPGLADGTQSTLLGNPYVVNQEIPAFAAGNKAIWFGSFRHYWIRDVRPMSVRRLDERYAEEDVFALLGFMRLDGRPVVATTVAAQKPLRCILIST